MTDKHPIFEQDPGEWMKLVNQNVRVRTVVDECYSGHVYTVDPVSGSVALVELNANQEPSLKVVFGHSITETEIIGTPLTEDEINAVSKIFKHHNQCPVANASEHKDKVCAWLKDNKIPVCVTVDADGQECLNISDALFIRSPYTADCCQSANIIMLSKVQSLINNMPK